MLRPLLLCAALLTFPAASAPSAEPQRNEAGAGIETEALRAIAAWLSRNHGLPPADEPPAIAFASSETMIVLRQRRAASNHASASHRTTEYDGAPHDSTIVAIYDDLDRTIYLPEGWTGSTPTEMSVLVHEMVHHLQNVAGMRFACAEEREQVAYAAQRDWLARSGRDFFADFGTDAFTLMARTHCAY